MKTFVSGLMCALLAGAAYGQSNSQSVLKPRNTAPVQELPSLGADTKISPDAPVITIQGVCQNASAAAECKTVITRADFERVADAIAPNLPKQQRKSLASQYVSALVLEQQAPDRVLYLSEKELRTILQEKGVVFQPEPGRTAPLLR